jgi:hypothetical protein
VPFLLDSAEDRLVLAPDLLAAALLGRVRSIAPYAGLFAVAFLAVMAADGEAPHS